MKNWYESKTYWAAIGLMILGLMHYWKSGDIVRATELIFSAIGLIGIRGAYKKIQ